VARSLAASQISQTLKLEKRNIGKSTAPVIYKHNRDRESLVGASAEGRQLQICQFTCTGTHSYSPSSLKTHTKRLRHTHAHTPQRHIPLQTQMCASPFIHTHTHYRGQSCGGCCQDITKTKSQPPLGMTEFDQSETLSQVRITFQLLKLMNSLSC